jgi:hypothetical protein
MPPPDALLLWIALAGTFGVAAWALARTYRLETTMNTRLDAIDRKLDALPTRQDLFNANQETVNLMLIRLGVMPPMTQIGTVSTGGGGAAVGGNVADSRKP